MLLGSGKKKEEERLGFKKLFYTFWLETVLQSVSYVFLFKSLSTIFLEQKKI